MKAKSLYIQKLAYDENTGNEIIGLFPSEANPAIVSSYTYDAKRMGGAPTLTATIYSSEPLQWKKEEFVEYNGDRFFASYTPNSTKDNSSRMWKSEITFTSRRELLDNTLFFDVVVDDVDTQNKDRYRSNQTKFTFGGTIHEFVARINSSMSYCGLYRPADEYKGYYVVIDEGYVTDEVKEVSFEDQYLTDVLQLINTTFELDYYWDGNVCHVGKVQHDLTDTPIKYGSSDALISVSKENANYKIVDMITGYGSSDNLPYYYPNDDEFGEAVFNTENISKDNVNVELSKFLKDSRYNDVLVLYKSKEGKSYNGSVDVSSKTFDRFTTPSNLTQADSQSNPTVTCSFSFDILINAIKGQTIDLTSLGFDFELNSSVSRKDYITNVGDAIKSIYLFKGKELYKTISKRMSIGSTSTYTFEEDGDFILSIEVEFSYKCKVYKNSAGINDFYGADSWNVSFSGNIGFTYESKSEYEWKNGDKYISYDEAGINIREISEANCIEYDYQFVKESDRYGFEKVYSGTDDNATKVVVTGRVWIAPSSVLMPSIYCNTKGAERFYYALNNTHKLPSGSGYYEFVNLYKKGNPHQGTVTFDDIKPTINGIVNAEGQLFGEIADVAFDSSDSDVKDSDGNYIHSYFYIKLHKFNGDFGFDLFAHALASESAKINLIKSNGCPACSFVIYNKPSADNSKYYNCVSVDENGNLKQVRTDKNDYIFANASDAYEDKLNQDSTQKELWIAVQKDTSTLGIVMPNASAGFKPQKGDLFVITGIKPPKVLVTAAEKRLDDALIKHMSENNTDQFNYSVKFSRIFLQENPDFASKLNENAKLSIQIQGDYGNDGNLISHEVFVSNYSVKVDSDELAEVEIELVNSLEVTKSDTKQIIDAVKGETVKSLSGMVGGNNTNNFNASIADKMYISKLTDDTAKGTITWEKIQKLLSGLLVGNSNSENGGSWTPDAEGRSHLITDYLEVRMKAIFEELVIKKTSTIGGKEIISPAGGVVAHKVEEVTVTYNNVSQKAYRCYFLAEQEGDAVDNDFAIGDQVRSESFNVRKGTYHKVGNHFYWRLVIGRDEEPVELEGKKYHYIDLSDTDCATASDIPAKGDVLSQCGNRTDVERQNCLIFSAVDTYSPSVSLYHGINSYSFANKEYVEYGVNKQTNKAFFNVYGDMYVGDRPTKENNYEGSSYIKYDSAAKQVSVKGKISAKSTVDGKELSQYIKDNSAKGLTEEQVNNIINNSQVIADLQNQVDGAIETWFYEGVPTLVNKPASDWKTDKDKDTHLGDLYYDNKTGKAYRFAKDGSTYKWTIITDTDIAKALSDASKAQETANGKMKVFSAQPTPPYQVGDIWVNATYPSDGSTYKNEVLRCQTKKEAGSQFAIGDWIKASKYTDDTVANAAKKAAEEAQKAAQTAQTNITNLGKTVTTNKKSFDNYVKDGYLEPSEIAAMAQDSKRLEDDFAAAQKSYNEVKGAEVLKDTKELTDLNTAFVTLSTAKTELVTYLSDISARYNAANTEKKATIVSAVGTKFTNFQSAYSAFYDKLGLANAYITSKIYGDLGVVIGDVATYQYLKKVLADGVETEINGGLILTSLIALRDPETKRVESGINGVIDKTAKGNGIATWWGGYMNDGEVVGFDKKEDYSKQAATSLVRFDGSGYLANGAIWWGTDGRVHADPTSFIISEKNLGAYLTFFEPTWKAGSAGTSVADLVSLKPNAPFTKLGVSGDATFEGSITFHGISITYDATNKAIKVDGNLYATGGISAYGVGTSSSSGGGLNGSVKAYADAIKLTTENLSEIASAYSVAKLYSEIQNVASAVPSISVSVPTGGNALTGATYNASTGVISFTKGTFLTAHQSLDGYVNAIAVSGSGNAVTAVTKSGKTITFTKGATYLTSHQSLSNYYTKSSVDSLLNGKSATTHTHSVKINGITKTIAASGGDAVDLGTYLTTHQSLAAYATQNWVKNEATAHNADMVDNYHASGLFTGFSISDVANKVTISIGGTSKALNLVRAFPSGVGNNFNDIATHGNSMGMSNIAAPYASSTANYQTLNGYVNPNGQTGWHHYINLSYTDSNNTETSPNMWQTQFAIKAGTTEVYVRSRAGGKISNSDAWAAPWVRLARVTDNVASASKVANALSWSGYSSGSYNGSAAKSISIPNNTNQLTNGAGFITASASISGNAGSATKLQNPRTINGTSFNGTANIVTSYWGTTRKLWGNSVNGNADVNGSITIANTDGVYVQIGDVRLVYDKANTAIKVVKSDGTTAANFYATGGITAFGEGSGSSNGGGLNGSVLSYASAIKLTSAGDNELSQLASAWSIAQLNSRIVSLEDGSALDVVTSGTGNAVTAISKNGTTINVTKGTNFLTSHQSLANYLTKTDASNTYLTKTAASSTYQPKGSYLTAHQSLDGYVNNIATSGTGNAITSVTKSGKTVTFTKGATYLTSHQSLSNYYTKSSVDSLLNGKSATTHTHSVKINGITKTIAASGGDAVDLGTYLTTHQSLAAYATQNWVKNEATAHNADMVDNYHASGLFTGFSISDVANKVTISIGGTSKALNLVRAFPSGVGNNFNDIATHGNSMGMSNIAAPYASSTANYQTLNGYVNPNGQTGWHHYINLSYTDSNNTETSPNMWQTQFAIKAGTTEVYVRSRAGGKISNSDAWAAPWVRLARVTDNVASASKVANALSWSGYSSGSYNGSAAKSISIPNNTNQLTNGAGFITASASISGNAGSATKLQNPRTINGTSFNGTANIVTSYWGTTRKLWGNSVNGNADVNGSITIANTDGVYVQIGDVRLVYDKANTAIKVVKSDGTTAANFYATGGITAFGEGSGSSNGGGLNGSVLSYASAIKLTSAGDNELSQLASAWSIAQLNSRIVSLEDGSALDVVTSGTGNAVTAISKNGTTINVTKGTNFLTSHQSLANYLTKTDASNTYLTKTAASSTYQPKGSYLTAHQSLDGYVNNIATSGTGNAITSVTKSGKTVTFTKGSTFLTSHQSLANYYTKGATDNLLSAKQDASGSLTFFSSNDNYAACRFFYDDKLNKLASEKYIEMWSNYGFFNIAVGNINTSKVVIRDGTSSQFLKADGSLDNKTYLTNHQSLDGYINNITTSGKGNAITSVSKSGKTITFAKGSTFLTSHQSLDGYVNNITTNGTGNAITSVTKSGKTITFTKGSTFLTSHQSLANYYTKGATDNLLSAKQDASGSLTFFSSNDNYAACRFFYDDKLNKLASEKYIEMWTPYGFIKLKVGNIDVIGNVLATGGITAYSSSDIRLKQDLRKLDYLGIIKAMGGTFGFAWKKDNTRSIGWIAQHVLCNPHLKDIVETDDKGYYKINYWSPKLIATAFGAIEQVGDEVSRLKARVVFLESEVQRLSGEQVGSDNKRLDNKNIKLLN